MARRRHIVAVLVGAIAILLVAVCVSIWFLAALAGQRQLPEPDRIVTIDSGMSTRQIVTRLAEAGVIPHERSALLWLTVTGQGTSLKAGDYQFRSPISPLEAIDQIRRGEIASRRVTIPEGTNRFALADLLAEKTGLGTRERFLSLTARPDLIRDLDPEATSLEGYLFPDTYSFTDKMSPDELIGEMVQRFRSVYASKPEMSQKAAERHLTLHELVTLASMIEEEAQLDEERPLVASVFFNRLAVKMELASDPTFIYAALLADDYDGDVNNPRHRARMSPYNTYQFEGLPPGPIASPGWKSMEAVLNPAESRYMYFVVSGSEGRHKFSKTAAEHEVAVQEYRRQQRAAR